MQRRKALATAGAISATALAATIALGANLGLFGLATASGGPGTVEPVSPKVPTTRTEVIDVPVPVAVGSGGGASGTPGASSAPAPAPAPAAAPAPQSVDHAGEREVEEPEEHSDSPDIPEGEDRDDD
jgi:hypothetical protein